MCLLTNIVFCLEISAPHTLSNQLNNEYIVLYLDICIALLVGEPFRSAAACQQIGLERRK